MTAKLLLPLAFACSLVACGRSEEKTERMRAVTGGDPVRGKQAITDKGCGACHVIPGVPGAKGALGPPLEKFGLRAYVAGATPNTPDNVAHFVQDPRAVYPQTAMPNLGLSADEARDVAAYLTSLD
jgi:cytochrome c2